MKVKQGIQSDDFVIENYDLLYFMLYGHIII